MWSPDYRPDLRIGALNNRACVCSSVNFVGHRRHAKNLWHKLKDVVTQYFGCHNIVLGIEDANHVPLLEKEGCDITQSKMPVAAAMRLEMTFGRGVQQSD